MHYKNALKNYLLQFKNDIIKIMLPNIFHFI
jgi:hypothetical protein